MNDDKTFHLDELKIVKAEMEHLKQCITTFIGYIFAGVGASVYGMTSNKTGEDGGWLAINIFANSISIIISMVLLLLFYKFTSHNRFAGYCKVITEEKVIIENNDKCHDLFRNISWEVSIDLLRHNEAKENSIWINYLNKNYIFKEILSNYVNEIDAYLSESNKISDVYTGAKLLFKPLTGGGRYESWAYPVYVSFFFLSFIIITELCTCFTIYNIGIESKTNLIIAVSVSVIVGIIQAILWWKFCRKLFRLIYGNNSINSFYIKFLIIRYIYFKRNGCQARYLDKFKIAKQ